MSRSWHEIRHTMAARRSHDAALVRRMIDVRDRVHQNEVAIPVPTIPDQPEFNALAPALIADGIDNTAMRANGPMPTIHVPAVEQRKVTGKKSLEYASIRRRAYYGRWHKNDLTLQLGRAYRQLGGYGTFAWVVMPEWDKDGMTPVGAQILIRDPLGTYPETRTADDMRPPTNVGFVYGKSADYLLAKYPESRTIIEGERGRNYKTGDDAGMGLWDVVEWIDEDDIVIGILGPRSEYLNAPSSVTPSDQRYELGNEGLELRRWDNRAGICPVVTPRRITLDRIAGQMDNIIPIVDWLNMMMVLETAAGERGVYPDIAIIGDTNQTPKLVSGTWHDGRTGKPNLLEGVKAIQPVTGGPSQSSVNIMNMLERNARSSGRVSPLYSGEAQGASLRTGRALDTMGAFSVDPGIQELQRIMSVALSRVNECINAVELGYWPKHTFTIFSGWPSERGQVEYTPEKHFETRDNVVSYAFPGSDLTEITVGVQQMAAGELMSKHTARDKHPWIEDADNEERYILQEQLEKAVLVGIQQKLVSGEMPMEMMADIYEDIRRGVPQMEALTKAIRALQEKQAQAAQAAQAQAQGGIAAQPEMQRGVGPPGSAPAEQAGAAIPPPNQGQRNVSDLVRAVTGPARAAQAVR